VQEADRKAKEDIAYREKEIAALKQDLARFRGERDMMRNHVAALDKRIADVDHDRRQMFASNQQLESELSMLVHQAADEINRRVSSQVNSKSAPAGPSN
jgi:septal ring factor EnvC (AmiA/AmiB activator)